LGSTENAPCERFHARNTKIPKIVGLSDNFWYCIEKITSAMIFYAMATFFRKVVRKKYFLSENLFSRACEQKIKFFREK